VLTEATKYAMLKRGDLRLASSAYNYGALEANTRATLKGLRHGPRAFPDAANLLFTTGSQNRLGLGYQFLKNYVSVWDYQRHVLTLLRP
jgi:hypothetical protein